MQKIYVIVGKVNEYGERHIDRVECDEVLHYKSHIYVTKNNGFVRDQNVMLQYNALQLRKLLMENGFNGYFSRELNNQYKAQKAFEDRLLLQRA